MADIDSDGALLTALGFSTREAGARLRRTRQAMDIGLARGQGYLKPHEIALLLLMARRRGHSFDAAAVGDYVRKVWDDQALEEISDLLRPDRGALDAGGWKDLWAIVNDFRRLRREGRGTDGSAYEELVALPLRFPEARIIYICAAPFEKDQLIGDLTERGAYRDGVSVYDAVPAAAQMTQLVGDPLDDPQVFMPAEQGFVRMKYYEGDQVVANLRALFMDVFPNAPRRQGTGTFGR